MGDEEVEYKAEYLDTAEDAEPEVHAYICDARWGRPHPCCADHALSLTTRGMV